MIQYTILLPDGSTRRVSDLVSFAKTEGIYYQKLWETLESSRPHKGYLILGYAIPDEQW